MASAYNAQLVTYGSQLQRIIRRLSVVEQQVRRDFSNVGNEACANSLASVIAKYQQAYQLLMRM